MSKIAVMGAYDSIYGFGTLGLDTFPVKEKDEAAELLRRLAGNDYLSMPFGQAFDLLINPVHVKPADRQFQILRFNPACGRHELSAVSGPTLAGDDSTKKNRNLIMREYTGNGPVVSVRPRQVLQQIFHRVNSPGFKLFFLFRRYSEYIQFHIVKIQTCFLFLSTIGNIINSICTFVNIAGLIITEL